MTKSANGVEELTIIGCGGHGRSVADVALANGIKKLVFVDAKARENETLFGFAVLPTLPASHSQYGIFAISNNEQRAKLETDSALSGLIWTNIISDKATIGVEAKLSAGCFIGHGAHVGPRSMIGKATIINTHSVIEHDCVIGNYCHVSVNATIAGQCRLGDFVMVGAGAVIIENVTVCSQVIIGAGAVVVKDIVEPGTYVGVPARKIG
jgi:UDP-N-acetylbacillosamine N-acetyltransferase